MKFLTTIALCTLMSASAFAESEGGKIKDDAHDAAVGTENVVKKTGRKASDAACPIVNGKVKCAAKKLKHKAQNASDDLKK